MKTSLLLVAVACPLLVGCLFPWMMPTVTHIPPVLLDRTAGSPDAVVHAFHCDVTTHHGQFIGGGQKHVIAMREVKVAGRAVPRHLGAELDRGLGMSLLGGWDFSARYHSTCIKLYCREYSTIVLGPKDDRTAVAWKKLNGPAPAEETPTPKDDPSNIAWVKLDGPDEGFQAIRDLLLALPLRSAISNPKFEPSPLGGPDAYRGRRHPRLGWDRVGPDGGHLWHTYILRPASFGEEQREFLTFAKEECVSLIKGGQPSDELRRRIEYQIARLDELLAQ